MEMQIEDLGNKGKIILSGDLDTNSSPEAEKIFLETAERFGNIILDMRNVEYVSSAGLRVLKRLVVFLKEKDGVLEVMNVKEEVMEVFSMVGFSKFLNIR